MSEIFPVPESIAKAAHCDAATYEAMYQRSIDDPEGFWADQVDQTFKVACRRHGLNTGKLVLSTAAFRRVEKDQLELFDP